MKKESENLERPRAKTLEDQKWVLERTVEFARNAEQKASILFGVFAVFYSIFMSNESLNSFTAKQCESLNVIGILILAISLVAAIVSLITFALIMFAHIESSNPSLIYFGSLATMSKEEIRAGFQAGISEEDYEAQIMVNSKICQTKYRLFNACVVSTLASVIAAIAFSVLVAVI